MSRESKFSAEQIAYALKHLEAGFPMADVCWKYRISQQTINRGRSKYGEMATIEVRRLNERGLENPRLKAIVADFVFDKEILQDALRNALKPARRRELVRE